MKKDKIICRSIVKQTEVEVFNYVGDVDDFKDPSDMNEIGDFLYSGSPDEVYYDDPYDETTVAMKESDYRMAVEMFNEQMFKEGKKFDDCTIHDFICCEYIITNYPTVRSYVAEDFNKVAPYWKIGEMISKYNREFGK